MKPVMIPYEFERLPPDEMAARASELRLLMQQRRSIRSFSTDPVPRELIEEAITIAGTAPSGAHLQPWTWVVVADTDLKQRIREAAEAEERDFYEHRAPDEWLAALAPLGTDAIKSHLTDAPWIVVLFRHRYEILDDGTRRKNYYSTESCGIAAGFFLAAVHQMGLAALTHTPSPMAFLADILERPANEQAFLVMPVGYPADDVMVPDIERKELDQITVWY